MTALATATLFTVRARRTELGNPFLIELAARELAPELERFRVTPTHFVATFRAPDDESTAYDVARDALRGMRSRTHVVAGELARADDAHPVTGHWAPID